MKEYKYKINGNSYKVTIGDIEDNIAHVEVNGTHYKVEMEKQPKAAPAKPVVRPLPNSPAAPTTPVVKPAAQSTGKSGVKSPLPGVILDIKSERRRHSEERTNHYYIGSHENGKQYQCRQRR